MAAAETTIAEVTSRWEDAYKIGGSPLEGYGALRRDGTGNPNFASTPGELWDQLVLDSLDPVPPGARG
jgi:hypothetical protein